MASTEAETSPETRQAQFEQGVAISLHLWISLTVAVQNGLGGPDSDDKRDWFAGAIVDMFPSFVDLAKPRNPSQKVPQDPIAEDVEATLLQVMWDEFETNVDDDSEVEVADRIVKARTQCAAGNFEFVEELRRRWLATKGKTVKVQEVDGEDQETDWESDDDEDEEDEDVEMDEAPALVAVPKERPPPEVDEDGFTKVTRKKR
ncbi:pre-rRNA-processing protein TSR2 [Annulohypoxylon truncatum]|uniref:pre-rRNA-processing protein TSR2 n=1 Tax=Annulohypoxylon truncatum TaxID=327061 RepID=UPI002008BA78|nr:pre-rRNA-processing protein TSR2 [Annulohypoxylon truncatum]KAI1211455.1 pre-rRNA-processing protein TSR2 [Annulohypoxylon truncatum]